MFLPQDLAGEADKHFNLPILRKAINIVCPTLLWYKGEQDRGISEATDAVVFPNLFPLSCYATTAFVHQNAGQKFGLHAAPRIVTTGQPHEFYSEKQTSNQPQTPSVHLSFTQQGQRMLLPFPTYSSSSALTFNPLLSVSLFACLLLRHSQSPRTAHLSICTLTCSLQPELISGDDARLTLMTLQNRKVN